MPPLRIIDSFKVDMRTVIDGFVMTCLVVGFLLFSWFWYWTSSQIEQMKMDFELRRKVLKEEEDKSRELLHRIEDLLKKKKNGAMTESKVENVSLSPWDYITFRESHNSAQLLHIATVKKTDRTKQVRKLLAMLAERPHVFLVWVIVPMDDPDAEMLIVDCGFVMQGITLRDFYFPPAKGEPGQDAIVLTWRP